MIVSPVPTNQFWETLRFAPAPRWQLTNNTTSTQTDSGELLPSSRGARLWRATVPLAITPNRAAAAVQARLEVMARAGHSFLAWPLHDFMPASDPTGMILGAAAPVAASLPASLFEMRISGLPAGYIISTGDIISVLHQTYRRALLRVAEDATADISGLTPAFQIEPARPGGIVDGDAVTLIKPLGKFKIVPGSYNAGAHNGVNTTGASFDIVQTLA